MKKLFKHILIVSFFVILCLPFCISLIQGIDTDDLPQLVSSDGKLNTDFDVEMNKFVIENQPFYNSSIILNNCIKSGIFKSEVSNVITGKEGYYFYTDTKNDILHINTLSEREIYNLSKSLELIDEYCQNNGCKFVFTVAPNKATIYPQFLPANYNAAAQSSNLQKLENELKNHNVSYADLKSVLLQADNPAYLKTDTHWNNYGALLAYNEIVRTADCSVPSLLSTNQDFTKKQDWNGDLSAMLYKDNAKAENQYYINTLDEISNAVNIRIRGEKTRKTDELIKKIAMTSENYVSITAKSSYENANGNVLILRDSFCRSMFLYFAYTYSSSSFIKSAEYNSYTNPADDYDIIILETAERNLPEILENEQIIPAPQRENIKITADISDSNSASIDICNDYADYTFISGEIDGKLLQNRENIYVKITDKDSNISHCYEAFSAGESDCKFKYYLTIDQAVLDGSQIQVIVSNTIVADATI